MPLNKFFNSPNYCLTHKHSTQRGVALIMSLIIVLIVMAIISTITIENYRIIRRLTNEKIKEQAQSILKSAIDLGRAGLATSGAYTKVDALTDIWAQPLPRTNVLDDIEMSGYIVDEQGKFNINDLVNNGQINHLALQQFSVLLRELNLPISLAYAIAVYMAAPQYQQEIMRQYTMGEPAYRPAGRALVDLSELLLVKGMNKTILRTLSDYITAIPQLYDFTTESLANGSSSDSSSASNANTANSGGVLVNVNTASAYVIAAKSGIPYNVAQLITTVRSNEPFVTTDDIMKFLASNGVLLAQNNMQLNLSSLTTTSNYFTIHAIINSGDYEFKWVALVNRVVRTGMWPQIVWQHPE